jgi:hypothetical protein
MTIELQLNNKERKNKAIKEKNIYPAPLYYKQQNSKKIVRVNPEVNRKVSKNCTNKKRNHHCLNSPKLLIFKSKITSTINKTKRNSTTK